MKKLLAIAVIVGLAVIMTAASALQYKVYLPIVFRPYERRTLQCAHYLHDSYGISAGYVQAWMTVEYHDQFDAVRLVQEGDKILFRWETHLSRSNFGYQPEINYLWQNPNPDTDWHGSGSPITVGSAWEAVTHVGGSKGYTIYVYGFPESHSSYPIRCTIHEH